MTNTYIVTCGWYNDPNGKPLAIFADHQAAEQWAAQYKQAHPEYFGRDQWVIYVDDDPIPFIPEGGTPPDPATIIAD
jgi:hypothetical protein